MENILRKVSEGIIKKKKKSEILLNNLYNKKQQKNWLSVRQTLSACDFACASFVNASVMCE